MALNRDALDRVLADGCAAEGCDHGHGGPLYFHSVCHPDAPTWAKYEDGEVVIECAECGKRVVAIEVPLVSQPRPTL